MVEKYVPMVAQCRLLRGTTTTVGYLDVKKKFKIGDFVTVKNLEGWWRVETIGRAVLASSVENDWHNNI